MQYHSRNNEEEKQDKYRDEVLRLQKLLEKGN